jgi:hypothetical protein
MAKIFKYAFFTSTVAYLMAAVLVFVYSIAQTGWSRIDSDIGTFLPSALTLALSEFSWWGDFYGLAVLVPWFGSVLVLALLMFWLDGGARRRRLLGGLSVGVYYLSMFLAFIIEALIGYWGDIAYSLLAIWPFAGFGVGYLAAFIVDKIMKPQFAV